MRRRLIFRGRQIGSNKKVMGYLTGIYNICNVEIYPDSIEQCTGLEDVHGIYIFEGDQVRLLSSDNDEILLVKWDYTDCSFGLFSPSHPNEWIGDLCANDDYEVI